MFVDRNISVVLATHNGSRFIAEQLTSVIRQTLAPCEIIVTDDASTDDTVDIVQSIADDCAISLKIIRNKAALGFRDNFLRAALEARGDFVAFCDQDDIWDTSKLEQCARFFADRSIAMIVHAAISVDQSNQTLAPFSQGIRNTTVKPPLSYDPWLTFFGFSMVFRRALLDLWTIEDRFVDYIVPNERIAHDRWIMFLAQMVGATAELEGPLVRYRQHGRNLFGDGKRGRRPPHPATIGSAEAYIAATSGMIRIVENLPDTTCRQFPLFDRPKALQFLRRALRQLTQRRTIYTSATRMGSLRHVAEGIASGVYRSVHDDRTRWRSIARDVLYAVFRR